MEKTILGVDIGGTSIKIGQFQLDGTLLQKWDIPTNRKNDGAHILEDIVDFVKQQFSLDSIKGIGFGVPGPVSNDVVSHCVNLGWGRVDVRSRVQELLGRIDIDIKASNDANLAAAGEVFQGAAKGYQNVCMFTLGTGVGGGIIVHGQLVNGKDGSGGELGHILIDRVHQFSCNCGKKGCLDTIASATGIVNLAKVRLQSTTQPSLLRTFENFSAKRVFDVAKGGDELAIEVVKEASAYLAQAMAYVTMTLNPDIFLFGGGVSNAGEYLIEHIKQIYFPLVQPFVFEVPIGLAKLGNDAGIYGAAYMVK
ncbi:MAG: ROK family glucokinase [Candidatus Izemoplasmatales bacterium]|nr:ROK family glucokinase [Candidatus Izemoplasmatales bacterium]